MRPEASHFLFLILLPFFSYASAILEEGNCPNPIGVQSEVEKTLRDHIAISEKLLMDPKLGKYRKLPNGTLVAPSCSSSIIDRVVGNVVTQLKKCHEDIKQKELLDAIKILKHTRIQCTEGGGGTWATNDAVYRDTSGAAKARDSKTGILIYVEPNRLSEDPKVLLNLSMVLAHEALHSTPCNNRSAHHLMDPSRIARTCEKSGFRDRVYFLSTVCFPAAEALGGGGDLFVGDKNILDECKGNCEAALGEVDSDITSVLPGEIIGPRRNFTEVHPVCERIRERGLKFRSWKWQEMRMTDAYRTSEDFLPNWSEVPEKSIVKNIEERMGHRITLEDWAVYLRLGQRFSSFKEEIWIRQFRGEYKPEELASLVRKERNFFELEISGFCKKKAAEGPLPKLCSSGYTFVNETFQFMDG